MAMMMLIAGGNSVCENGGDGLPCDSAREHSLATFSAILTSGLAILSLVATQDKPLPRRTARRSVH
eukprot:6593706-Pyramimonas_sp.AAC.1